MKETFEDLRNAIREICQGSGNINFLSILITTIIVYLGFLIISSRNLFFLLIGLYPVAEFESSQAYLNFLENIELDELGILVPIIVVIILIMFSIKKLKESVQNRLLPISPALKVVAFICIVLFITLFSTAIVWVMDLAIIKYTKYTYLSKVIDLQESMLDFYKPLPYNKLFSNGYESYRLGSKRYMILPILSVLIFTIMAVFELYFKKYSIIKGVITIIIIVATSLLLNFLIEKQDHASINVRLSSDTIFLNIFFPIIIICGILSFYFLLKQRED